MRVIAGKFRSRTIEALPGLAIRPTYDRLKETLFNVLAALSPSQSLRPLEGSVFLDLFAGTGSIGIEALSRGASEVYFVESNPKAVRLIRQNLAALEVSEGFEILPVEAAEALRQLGERNLRCQYCFLDPPYQMQGAYEQTLRLLAASDLLADDGIVIAEHDRRFDPGTGTAALRRYRIMRQGESALSFYALDRGNDGHQAQYSPQPG
jgi:16S rRNA (guanine(966)-N(2))-methyltransferase RsmD